MLYHGTPNEFTIFDKTMFGTTGAQHGEGIYLTTDYNLSLQYINSTYLDIVKVASAYYNIIVTQYEPDNLKSYLASNEIVYDKTKMNGTYQVGSGRIVAVTHDTPFIEDIVPHSAAKVNPKFSLPAPSDDSALPQNTKNFLRFHTIL